MHAVDMLNWRLSIKGLMMLLYCIIKNGRKPQGRGQLGVLNHGAYDICWVAKFKRF